MKKKKIEKKKEMNEEAQHKIWKRRTKLICEELYIVQTMRPFSVTWKNKMAILSSQYYNRLRKAFLSNQMQRIWKGHDIELHHEAPLPIVQEFFF